MSDSRTGRFVWHDLMTLDPEASAKFYAELIGWGTREWEGGDQPYTMWTNGDTTLGGLMILPEQARQAGAPPHWMAYLFTPDIEATLARAEELGSRILVPATAITAKDRFGILTDPQGAPFAVYSSKTDPPAEVPSPVPGEFSWHELITTDYEAAFGFYRELFGWEKGEWVDMGEMGIYQMFNVGGVMTGGMFNKTADMPMPPAWLHYIMVPSADAAAEKVKELGGQVVAGPMEVPGGDRIAQCIDPQGAAFAVHSKAEG
jgi:predicted enzyme related to lactoylglutathione lyase